MPLPRLGPCKDSDRAPTGRRGQIQAIQWHEPGAPTLLFKPQTGPEVAEVQWRNKRQPKHTQKASISFAAN